tara:strand:- start:1525 stop:2433 length:909 start_codon:yes stop_codon:yes gene_type:complete
MITTIKRQDLNVVKYDACIENSIQSNIYGFSWYLDIVADTWAVLVLDDYKAVMPIPIRKKYGIKYVYPPFWLLELGVFSMDDSIDYQLFFEILFNKFKAVETRLNVDNRIQKSATFLLDKQMQLLSIKDDYEAVFDGYRKDRKKDLRKAQNANLVEKWNDSPKNLIQLFKNNVGKRTPYITNKDYAVLEELIETCIENGVGDILSIYSEEKTLVAAGFFLKHKNKVTILVSSTDFNHRKNGENTFLIDRAIFKYQLNYDIFHFGGSSMESIAKFFLSFGAETYTYQQIKYRNLSFLMKLFKR